MRMRKSIIALVFLAAACGFAFQLGERRAEAVPSCASFLCVSHFAYWSGFPGTECLSHHKSGTADPNDAALRRKQGSDSMWAVAEDGTKKSGVIELTTRFKWGTSTPNCDPGKGAWPQPIDVAPGGKTANPISPDVNRYNCVP